MKLRILNILFMIRILIAEDEARLAAFLEKGLRKHGFITTVAEDGQQAIRMAQTEDFHLILLDLGLPIKDGWTVLRELRSRGEALPIIVVTAQVDEGNRAAVLNAGADDFVAKPFRFSDLLDKVRSHLSSSN
jgi:two-component system, OmpR family, copper resistance phosphate regulon response regulator CusR